MSNASDVVSIPTKIVLKVVKSDGIHEGTNRNLTDYDAKTKNM